MKTYYEKKAEFHYTQWQLATDANKKKAADSHMIEYLNYMELQEQTK